MERKCFIHDDRYSNEVDKLRLLTETSREKLEEASKIRGDAKIRNILRSSNVNLECHQQCLNAYIHPKTLKKFLAVPSEENSQKNEGKEKRFSARKKGQALQVATETFCCICNRKKWVKGSYEKLRKCSDEDTANKLKSCALEKNDLPQLVADLTGKEWQSVIAMQIRYHHSCYSTYTRRGNSNVSRIKNSLDENLNKVYEFIQRKVILSFEIVKSNDLYRIYYPTVQDKLSNRERKYLLDLVVKKFGTAVAIWTPAHGSAFIFNNELEKGKVIELLLIKIECLEKKLKAYDISEETTVKKIQDVGEIIRQDIIKMEHTYTHWPPDETELLRKQTKLPATLTALLSSLLKTGRRSSANKNRLVKSIGEDIIYNGTGRVHKTTKHIILSLCTKRKTGSKEVIQWLNKYGHGISNDDIRFVETFIAEEAIKNQNAKNFTPSVLQPSTFVTFVWDNNDINPESIYCKAMHCTNGIIVQLPQECATFTNVQDTNYICLGRKRSFKAMSNDITKYIPLKRANPPCIQLDGNFRDFTRNVGDSSMIDFLWVLLRISSSNVPSWSAFHYLLQEVNQDQKSVHFVTYLPSINESPTKMDVVLELLMQSKLKAEKLGLTETDIVLDQAIYAKAVEILMNPTHVELQKFIVLRMGAFHTTLTFLAVVGKRFADAGLRDWIIEADLLGEGSVENVLAGRHYNRAIRVYQYIYDALTRCRIECLQSYLLSNNLTELDKLTSCKKWKSCLAEINMENVTLLLQENEFFKTVFDHGEILKNTSMSGPTSSFWFSFIQMMDILFDFQRSIKTGDWHSHLDATRQMLPWFFAYDRQNYSRFLTFYWVQMKNLPTTHPDIYSQFMNGNFSVKRSEGRFNKVPTDQCIEQTINRQQKVSGGIIGFSLNEGSVQRWILTSHILSSCLQKLEEEVNLNKICKSTLKDLQCWRISFHNECVERSVNVIKDWGNPFLPRDELINICSGHEATSDIKNDLLNAESIGQKAFIQFVDCRIISHQTPFYEPIKRLNLKTFKLLNKQKVIKSEGKEIIIAAERSIFGRLLVIAKNRESLPLKEVLSYSLSPIPWCFGQPDGSHVKTPKSKFLDAILTTEDSCQIPVECAQIYDGMVLIQQLEKVPLATFGDVAKFLLQQVLKIGTVAYFVTDRYLPDSIKSVERSRRTSRGSIKCHIQRRDQPRVKQWSKYLSNADNKENLIEFLLQDWSNEERYVEMLKEKTLYVNKGSKFYKLSFNGIEVTCAEEPSLENKQEEADTKMFLCVEHAAVICGFSSVCLNTIDTDVVLYAIYFDNKVQASMFLNIGNHKRRRIINIKAIASRIGLGSALSLPAFHAFTGNDYTSAFHGIGKLKPWKMITSSVPYQQLFQQIGDTYTFNVELFSSVQSFVCQMYGLKSQCTNDGRYEKFSGSKKTPQPHQLPPTADALLCHCKRVNYVTAIIKRSLQPRIIHPSPNGFGWIRTEDGIQVQWMLRKPAPEEILKLFSCRCKKAKCVTNACVCKSHGLQCTDLCNCEQCLNDDTGLISSDDESYYSSSDDD